MGCLTYSLSHSTQFMFSRQEEEWAKLNCLNSTMEKQCHQFYFHRNKYSWSPSAAAVVYLLYFNHTETIQVAFVAFWAFFPFFSFFFFFWFGVWDFFCNSIINLPMIFQKMIQYFAFSSHSKSWKSRFYVNHCEHSASLSLIFSLFNLFFKNNLKEVKLLPLHLTLDMCECLHRQTVAPRTHSFSFQVSRGYSTLHNQSCQKSYSISPPLRVVATLLLS